jgi:hypothetical protein
MSIKLAFSFKRIYRKPVHTEIACTYKNCYGENKSK